MSADPADTINLQPQTRKSRGFLTSGFIRINPTNTAALVTPSAGTAKEEHGHPGRESPQGRVDFPGELQAGSRRYSFNRCIDSKTSSVRESGEMKSG